MKLVNALEGGLNELLNVRFQNLGSDVSPAAGNKGSPWFNTATNLVKVSDGAVVHTLTNLLESVSGSGAIQVGAVTNKAQAISILAASGSQTGTMSSSDFTKLANAGSTNTASTLVQRDASGNFVAGTITAALTGTATNASALGNQTLAQVRDFAQTTGQRTATSAISDFDTQVRLSRLDQFAAPIAAVALNNQRLTGVADPSSAQDAATKNYVDSVASGIDPKGSVRLASVGNVAFTYTAAGGTSTRGQITAAPNSLDGIALAVGNRVLLKNQTTAAQNGIWVVTTLGTGANGVWDRATDFDTDSEVTSGAFTFVEEGTQAATGWVLTTANPVVIGGASGTAIAFAQFSGGSAYTAGNGLQLAGNSFSAVGTANRVSVSGAGIDIAATYLGQTSITTVGTIGSGTWNATAISVLKGGTGGTTAAAAKANLGFTTAFSVDIGDGTATTITVTHNLGTRDVVVSVMDKATNEIVYANVVNATTTTTTVAFSTAPATAAYRVTVVG